MRDGNKVEFSFLFEELKKRKGPDYRYRWFTCLYQSWAAKQYKSGLHLRQYYSTAWKRGWIVKAEAQSFCQYMISGWIL